MQGWIIDLGGIREAPGGRSGGMIYKSNFALPVRCDIGGDRIRSHGDGSSELLGHLGGCRRVNDP